MNKYTYQEIVNAFGSVPRNAGFKTVIAISESHWRKPLKSEPYKSFFERDILPPENERSSFLDKTAKLLHERSFSEEEIIELIVPPLLREKRYLQKYPLQKVLDTIKKACAKQPRYYHPAPDENDPAVRTLKSYQDSEFYQDENRPQRIVAVNVDLQTVKLVSEGPMVNALSREKFRQQLKVCSTTFRPYGSGYKVIDEHGLLSLNMYDPPFYRRENFFKGTPLPKVDRMPEPYSDFLDHLFVGPPEEREYLLNWMAYSLRNRNIAILALVGSERGIGKGVFSNIMCALHGMSNSQWFKQSDITNRFNAGFVNKTLGIMDEVSLRNPKEADVIKTLSNKQIAVEAKGIDTKTEPIFINMIFCNNDIDCLVGVADESERQFSILTLTDKKLTSNPKFRRPSQIDRLSEDRELVRRLALYLIHREVPEDFPLTHFKSPHYYAVIRNSAPEWEGIVLEDYANGLSEGAVVSFAAIQEHLRRIMPNPPGRAKLERLAKQNPTRLHFKQIKGVRCLIFARRDEAPDAFKARCESVSESDKLKIPGGVV